MAASIALAEAKANLSSVVRRVDETGAEFVITVRKLKAAGALAGKRPKVSRTEEKAAYQKALEAKYVDLP